MSYSKQLEQAFKCLIENKDPQKAQEIIHQVLVGKSRDIYESLLAEEGLDIEDETVVGGDPDVDFTQEISNDHEEIDTDHEFDGEVDDDEDSEEDEEEAVEDRVDDLEAELEKLRAEFDALMNQELEEPNHQEQGLGTEIADIETSDMGDDGEEEESDFDFSQFNETAKAKKLRDADAARKAAKRAKKVAEETQLTKKVAATGQESTAPGFVGTGKDTPKGAEQDRSAFTNAPKQRDYGVSPKNIVGSKETGGEYGKFNAKSPEAVKGIDYMGTTPKKVGTKADTTPKWTDGKTAGEQHDKSPLSKRPQ